MNRQTVDDVDGRESPALASSPHPSPRPRVARRGGAHAPPKGVLAGLASTNDCGATPDRACAVRSCSSPGGRASFGSLNTEDDRNLRLAGGSDQVASYRNS